MNNVRISLKELLVVMVLFCLSCSAQDNADAIQNPVFGAYKSHDMSIVEGRDGLYYAFGNCNVARDKEQSLVYYGTNIFRSGNLVDWSFYKRTHQDRYPEVRDDKERAKQRQGQYAIEYGDTVVYYPMWAAEIFELKGKYLLFVALRNTAEDSKIALFETDDLSKDFEFKRIVVSGNKDDGEAYVNSKEIIDPFPIVDKGKLYLFYGSFARNGRGEFSAKRKDFGVYVVELDKKTFARKSDPIFISDYYEGCTILKRNGKFYLFGTNGALSNHTYKLSYAVSKSVTGPYLNHKGKSIADTVNVNLGKVILETADSKLRYNGFGCMSTPIVDKDGRYFVLMNGHDLNLPAIVSKNASIERYSFLLELHWDDEGNPFFDLDEIEGNSIMKPKIK